MTDKNFKVKSGLNIPITSAAILNTDASGNISFSSVLPISAGGTGQTSSNNALNALLPIQSGSTVGYALKSDGVDTNWSKLYNQSIKNNGTTINPRGILNVIGGTFTDDALNDTTTLTISGAYAAPTIGSTLIPSGTTVTTISGLTLADPIFTGTATSGSYIANATITGNSNAGAYSYGTLSYNDKNIIASFATTINDYAQILIQNKSNGATASADFIVSNDTGTATATYGDFGINSSAYTGAGAFNTPNNVYLYAANGDLAIGTTTNNNIRFLTNNSTTDVLTIASGGASTFGGAVTATRFIPSSNTIPTNGLFLPAANTVGIATNSVEQLRIDSVGDLWTTVGATLTSATIRYGDGTTTYAGIQGNYLSATTGSLVLQTLNAGTLTTALTIGSNSVATFANAPAVTGGTASGFLKANGSIDTTTYITAATPTFTSSPLSINAATPTISSNNASAASIFTSTVTGVTIGSSSIKTLVYPSQASGTTTGTVTTSAQSAGFLGMPQNAQATSGAFSYTLVSSDAGKHIYATGSPTSVTFTIPANSAVSYEIGTTIVFVNDLTTATNISIAITTDTMILAGAGTTGTRTLAQYGMATAVKVTSTKWIISGNGLT